MGLCKKKNIEKKWHKKIIISTNKEPWAGGKLLS
jgi:hypothetical protein